MGVNFTNYPWGLGYYQAHPKVLKSDQFGPWSLTPSVHRFIKQFFSFLFFISPFTPSSPFFLSFQSGAFSRNQTPLTHLSSLSLTLSLLFLRLWLKNLYRKNKNFLSKPWSLCLCLELNHLCWYSFSAFCNFSRHTNGDKTRLIKGPSQLTKTKYRLNHANTIITTPISKS